MGIVINEDPLHPDDPMFSGGVKIGFTNDPPVEDDDVEFIQPQVPGRYSRAAGPKPADSVTE